MMVRNLLFVLLCCMFSFGAPSLLFAEEDLDDGFMLDEDEISQKAKVCSGSGFVQYFAARRIDKDPLRDDRMVENDLVVDTTVKCSVYKKISVSFRPKVEYDHVDGKTSGSEIRELNVSISQEIEGLGLLRTTIGRQEHTMGVADMVVINNTQPMIWNSLYAGKPYYYWKGASDSLKTTLINQDYGTFEVMYGFFRPSVIPDGKRFSYFSPFTRGLTAETMDTEGTRDKKEGYLKWAKRFSSVNTEVGLYAYDGYYSTPQGVNATGKLIHPRLRSYGMTVRYVNNKLGTFWFEGAKRDSREDTGPSDSIKDDDDLWIIGYEKEFPGRIFFGMQYYEEIRPGEDYEMMTYRLMWRTSDDRWKLGLFYYDVLSSDDDNYLQASIQWDPVAQYRLRAGVNLFEGKPYGRLGQLEDASNFFVEATYFFGF